MSWCTNGMISAPRVCSGAPKVCSGAPKVCSGALVERLMRRRQPAIKVLQPIASSIFYILRDSWSVMLNIALLPCRVRRKSLGEYCCCCTKLQCTAKFGRSVHNVAKNTSQFKLLSSQCTSSLVITM